MSSSRRPAKRSGRSSGVVYSSLFANTPRRSGSPHEVRGGVHGLSLTPFARPAARGAWPLAGGSEPTESPWQWPVRRCSRASLVSSTARVSAHRATESIWSLCLVLGPSLVPFFLVRPWSLVLSPRRTGKTAVDARLGIIAAHRRSHDIQLDPDVRRRCRARRGRAVVRVRSRHNLVVPVVPAQCADRVVMSVLRLAARACTRSFTASSLPRGHSIR